ncbi:MAG: patatin-like phospholipase family protein [Saprospiraceae bacterium]|nr:patatin-like phospholipase family protein [Saprospiraceae bacterium]
MKIFLFIACIFCLCFGNGQSQNIKNLVFEGAGIRGLAYAGVIEEFEKNGIIDNIEKVGGTSAGAITALMVSLGYSSDEIINIVANTKFQKFNDGRYIFFGGFYRMKKSYGWYRNDKFLKWLEKIIEFKTANSEITFSELHSQGYKDLYVTATCLNKQKLIVFSHETYPDMKIKDAVRISMSIPLYFKAVFIDSKGKVYEDPKERNNLDLVVDGGVIGNFPIFLFDSLGVDSDNNQIRITNPETIGIRIDSDMQIQNDSLSKELAAIPINDIQDYISAFYTLVIENLNRNQLIEEDWNRTVSVSSVGVGPKIKMLSKTEKEKLVESGRKSAMAFLKNY